MANDLAVIVPKILARSLKTLRQRCIMPRLVNFDYSTQAKEKGDTIDVEIPTGMSIINVAPSNTPPAGHDEALVKVQVPLSNWKQNDPFHLNDDEFLKVDRDANYLPGRVDEAIKALANGVNDSIFAQYKGIYGVTGAAGTTPFATTVLAATLARKVLNDQLCPRDDRRAVIDSAAEANALALAPFSDAEKVGTDQVKIQGEIGRKFGIDWYFDEGVPYHTKGAAGTVLVDQADVTIGDTDAHFDGLTTKASVGDIFTVAGDTQSYVILTASDLTSTDGDVTFAPAAKVAWANDAAVTFVASHRVNLAFHRDAFAFATRPLLDTTSAGFDFGRKLLSLQDPVSGLVLRLEVSRQHKRVVWEFDILWGVKLVRPELAVRILG